MTNREYLLDEIAAYIKKNAPSKEKAMTGSRIGGHFKMENSTIRHYVNAARNEGYPICSCGYGYYYAEKIEDIENTVASLERRVRKQEEAIEGLKRLLMESQKTY